MTTLTDYGAIDHATFQDSVMGGDQPALMRGLVADWPLVVAAGDAESFTRAVVAGVARLVRRLVVVAVVVALRHGTGEVTAQDFGPGLVQRLGRNSEGIVVLPRV